MRSINWSPKLAPLLTGRQVQVRDWRHANDVIISVLQVQKDTMFIVLGMIVLVAAFNVVSSLIMLVKDKRADIAVLRTIGASSGSVQRIFMMCGAFVGVAGTVLGTIIGVVICRNIVDDPARHRGHHRRPGLRRLGVHVEHVAEHDRLGRRRRGSWCSASRCRCWRRCIQAGAPREPIRWRRCGMSDPLVLRDVHRTYSSEAGDLRVLRGVDLTLRAGEIVALVAPSGVGKSTLLHIAGLLDRPDQGAVLVEGKDAGNLPDNARTAVRRDTIGFVYQFHHLLAEFTALENVALPRMIAGRPRRDAEKRGRRVAGRVRTWRSVAAFARQALRRRAAARRDRPRSGEPSRRSCWRMNRRAIWTSRRPRRCSPS